MKFRLRYLLPWIPIIGMAYVAFLSDVICAKYNKNKIQYKVYIWGSTIAYEASSLFQGICTGYIFATIFNL